MKVEFIGGPCDGTVLEGESAEGTVFLGGYHKLGDSAIGKRVVIPPIWTRSILARGDKDGLEKLEQEDPRIGMHLIYQFEAVDPFRLRFVEARGVSGKKV
jgi:hypothetical protein